MKSRDLLNLLRSSVVFSDADASKLIGKQLPYTRLVLSRLSNSRQIKRVERGKYYLPGTDIYAIASNIVQPSYISLLSAFRFHNLTTQTIMSVDVITTKRHMPIDALEEHRINFINIGISRFFGYYRDKNTGAFVAHIEKAVLDSLYFGNPPASYIAVALENAFEDDRIDMEKLMAFANKMRSRTVYNKLNTMMKPFRENRDWHGI